MITHLVREYLFEQRSYSCTRCRIVMPLWVGCLVCRHAAIKDDRGVLVLSIRIDNGVLLASKVRVICRFWQRHWPLDRPLLSEAQGLLLNPGGSVHTFGMPCVIDVVFLDHQWRVLKLAPALRARRLALAPRATRLALLLPAGRVHSSGLHPGMSLSQDTSPQTVGQYATTVLRRAVRPGLSEGGR
jgi:hypothetical protein